MTPELLQALINVLNVNTSMSVWSSIFDFILELVISIVKYSYSEFLSDPTQVYLRVLLRFLKSSFISLTLMIPLIIYFMFSRSKFVIINSTDCLLILNLFKIEFEGMFSRILLPPLLANFMFCLIKLLINLLIDITLNVSF